MGGPLAGIKVIEMAEWIAVPSAGAILADWGADVVKIEPPSGDAYRALRSVQGVKVDDVHIWFQAANRDKRSIALYLKQDGALAVLDRLISSADVFTTNYRTAALRRLGVSYPRLKEVNPRLIYASLTGFGRQGPDGDKPGYDDTAFWGRTGFMGKLGEGMPYPPLQRPGIGDHIAGMMVVGAITAALLGRERTGQGQEVQLSLYHVGVWALSMDMHARLRTGAEVPTPSHATASNPLRNSYCTKDGRWMQLVMLLPERHWSQLCRAMQREDLEHDPRFATSEAMEKHCAALIAILDEEFAKRTAAEWEAMFSGQDVVFQRVNTISDVVEDPQAWANGFFAQLDHPEQGPLTVVASPARFDCAPAPAHGAAPRIGQHTEAVLAEAGYRQAEIEALRAQGIIP